jgi:hypothetical protein
LSFVFPFSDGSYDAGGISEVVSPESWFLSNHWSLLSTRQVAIEVCGC